MPCARILLPHHAPVLMPLPPQDVAKALTYIHSQGYVHMASGAGGRYERRLAVGAPLPRFACSCRALAC